MIAIITSYVAISCMHVRACVLYKSIEIYRKCYIIIVTRSYTNSCAEERVGLCGCNLKPPNFILKAVLPGLTTIRGHNYVSTMLCSSCSALCFSIIVISVVHSAKSRCDSNHRIGKDVLPHIEIR